jgi:uncharacterized membrane protein YdbT with pleckstrin-like domain
MQEACGVNNVDGCACYCSEPDCHESTPIEILSGFTQQLPTSSSYYQQQTSDTKIQHNKFSFVGLIGLVVVIVVICVTVISAYCIISQFLISVKRQTSPTHHVQIELEERLVEKDGQEMPEM